MPNLISYEDAVGDAPATPADAAPSVLTVRPGPASIDGSSPVLSSSLTPAAAEQSSPTRPAPTQAPTPAASDAPRLISYEEATSPDTPNPGGALSNAADDGYVSGALKGAGTAIIKGMGDAVGAVGGMGKLADYLIARVDAKLTGRSVEAVQAANAAKAAATEADMNKTALGRLASASDPTKILPAPDDVSGPILAKTGEYVPTSMPGRMAQAAVEAVPAMLGPGGGAISPGGAGKAVVGAMAKQAPAMAAAGAVGQGASEVTGDPLAGLGAGLVVPGAVDAVGSKVASVAAPVLGGSKLLNAAPVVGPALQAGREAAVASKIVKQSSDPAALRAWAAREPDAPEVPNSPRTLAGAVSGDAGLMQAEKDSRNVNNATPTARVTVDGQSYGGQSFNGIDGAQSDAQRAALQAGQQGADVFRPGQVISDRMDAIEAAAQQAEDRLHAAHADAVSRIGSAGQAFAADQQAGLVQRTADRQQAGVDFADQARAGLADRTADRVQGAADDKAQAQTDRDDAHSQLVQSFADAHARQLAAAQDAAVPLGQPMNAEDLGSTLRGAVEQVRSDAKAMNRSLYKAVDPEGTLALVATPVGDKAASIVDGLRADGTDLSPAEAPLFRRAAALPDVATYGTLHALDTDLTAAISGERRTAGETSTWARLSALKGSVKSAMTNAVSNQAAHEARQVAAGRMAPEDTMTSRLGSALDEFVPSEQPPAWADTGTDAGAGGSPRSAAGSGEAGAAVSGDGGSAGAARDPSLSSALGDAAPREVGTGPRPDAPAFGPDSLRAPQRPDVPRPQDLRAFVRSRGGMVDSGGDLAAIGMYDLIGKGARAAYPDRMREAAAEAGYLGADTARAMRETHPNDLLDALSGDRPVHSVRDENAAAAWQAYDDARERYDAARGEFGIPSRASGQREATPLDAYGRDDVEGPSGPQMREPSASGLTPNFGPEAAGRLREANAAYAEYARTYKNPTVGPGLRTTGFSGQYQRGDAAFIRGAVKSGAEGYEVARAYLRAAKNNLDAVDAMHDAALQPLRRAAAAGPGFVHPEALARWKASYGPALRALDEVTPGFSARFDDAAEATRSLLDIGARSKPEIEAARKEAARQAVIDDADRKARLGQANAADKATVADLLSERAANDRATTQADKASTSSALSDRATSGQAAIAQSRADTAERISAARGIVRDARATPAAQFAAKGGTGVASTEVENAVGSYLKTGTSGATRTRALVESVANDPEALAGLRKAGSDWLVRTNTNADGALSGAGLIRFMRDNEATLRELYPPDQLRMMGAVARDAEVNARWRTATAIKGGSDSAKNLHALAGKVGESVGHGSMMFVALDALKDMVIEGHVSPTLIGSAAGAYLISTLRQAGIRRTADLYQAALADPALARALLAKMPAKAEDGAMAALAQTVRRSLILGAMATDRAKSSSQPSAAPAVAAERRGGLLSDFMGR